MKIIITNILWEQVTPTSDISATQTRWKVDYDVTFSENHYIKGRLYWFRKDCIIEEIKAFIGICLKSSLYEDTD